MIAYSWKNMLMLSLDYIFMSCRSKTTSYHVRCICNTGLSHNTTEKYKTTLAHQLLIEKITLNWE